MRAVAAASPGYRLKPKQKETPRRALLSYGIPTFSGAAFRLFFDRRIEMEKDMALDMMLAQRWSNNACRGYVIWAMENCGYKPDDIQRVISELHYVFDVKGITEADKHYCNSPY